MLYYAALVIVGCAFFIALYMSLEDKFTGGEALKMAMVAASILVVVLVAEPMLSAWEGEYRGFFEQDCVKK